MDLVPSQRPPKQDAVKRDLLFSRTERAMAAHRTWAESAKKSFDYVENRQWDADTLRKLKSEGKPALTYNMIKPLVLLVMGYHENNQTDTKYKPGNDANAMEEVAEGLTHLFKQGANLTGLEYVNTEVVLDGFVGGRGFWDIRMDFQENDLGEIRATATDPFSVYVDPDLTEYDLNKAGFIDESRWVCIDEIEFLYGKAVADTIRPFVFGGGAMWTSFPEFNFQGGEITPIRSFGRREGFDEVEDQHFQDFFHHYMVDPLRKSVRLIDHQYKAYENRMCFVDLETGDRKAIPTTWNRERIQKVLFYANENGGRIAVQKRMEQVIKWTTTVADVMAWDGNSPYETFTKIGFFPWFRRGITDGMVSDLIDPQDEVNKRASAEVAMVMRSGNGQTWIEEGSLRAKELTHLKRHGSAPGFVGEYKRGYQKPEKDSGNPPPTTMEKLQQNAADRMKEISGINQAALGQLDRVQSGRALEARQRQTVIGLQMYLSNLKRSKEMIGGKFLNLFQRFYTEERVYRITGKDGNDDVMVINQPEFGGDGKIMKRLLDITVGKYAVVVDERPMAAAFEEAQFEELLLMLEKMGPSMQAHMPMMADLIVDASSIPNKEQIVDRLKAIMGIQEPGPAIDDPNTAGLGIAPPAGPVGAGPMAAGPLPVVGPASPVPTGAPV